jgi:prolyl-tRNA editing enzyme YbaK/EbsC (Cys-tRNA(Pro) deacylase)
MMLTPDDLQTFMDENHIPGEILLLDVPTPTVEAAAQAVGTDPERIVKSVLFRIGDGGVLAITSGTLPIDQRAIAALYGVGRKRVKLADPETVLRVTGYPVGTVPPFGHATPSRTLLDPGVLEFPEIYAGGGAHNALVRIDPQEILRVTQAEIIDLHSKND